MKIICFDIGGTKIAKAVIELRGNKFNFFHEETEKNPNKPESIQKIILNYAVKSKELYKTSKVGISATCIINPFNKTASETNHQYGIKTFDFKFLAKNGFDIKVENDARCFALGEHRFGNARGSESLLALTLGTYLGGAYLENKRLLRGKHFSATEVSFMKLALKDSWKTWDELVGGKAFELLYQKATQKKVSAKEIFIYAKAGDQKAKEIIEHAKIFFGIGLANLLNIFDPQIVVVGGSISKETKFVQDAFKIAKANHMNKTARYQFAISKLKNKSNLLGAATLFD